ncbi:hypothetical protein BDV93DRAFT_448691 [Ceratobasidium sp. AG-I]|nr:hypothetical protein BDV93DRAFT_448691 [Ceratobasidium sp. AG-I]
MREGGEQFRLLVYNLTPTPPILGYDIPDSDMLVMQAFNYKVDTDISGAAFSKLPRAFPTRLNDLPSEKRIRTRVTTLSGMEGVKIDCCFNSCVAYTGAYRDLTECPYPKCGLSRFEPDPDNIGQQRPRKMFFYVPLIPRLINMYRDPTMARHLYSRSQRKCAPDGVKDIFDRHFYRRLRKKRVSVAGKTLNHRHCELPTDVALGLSTDGFRPFKSQSQTC